MALISILGGSVLAHEKGKRHVAFDRRQVNGDDKDEDQWLSDYQPMVNKLSIYLQAASTQTSQYHVPILGRTMNAKGNVVPCNSLHGRSIW